MREGRQRTPDRQRKRNDGFLMPLNLAAGGVAALLVLSAAARSLGAAELDGPPVQRVDRVEEDWRVVIGTPSPREIAPQIVTVMSPTAGLDELHSVFELNHSTMPEFLPGGMQLQIWRRGVFAGYRSFPKFHRLNTPDEVIEFTSRMRLDDGHLTFEIVDGQSQTWDSFGGDSLKHSRQTSLQDLNGYRPETSIRNSFISFAAHRVRKLEIREVRYYSGDERLSRDTNPRVAHEHSPDL